MLDDFWNSNFSNIMPSDTDLPIGGFLVCLLSAIAIGALISFIYMFKNNYTKSFVITLALLPSIVCVVIMMVSGSLGAAVAVAGTFTLVRFRSIPGTAKEIGFVFFAMASGIAIGTGYIGFSLAFVVMVGAISMVYTATRFGSKKTITERTVRITIPEDLNYTDVFNTIFAKYTTKYELVTTKTSNMGSLYKITYKIVLKDVTMEKDMIDDLRCRNGNLEISSSIYSKVPSEL